MSALPFIVFDKVQKIYGEGLGLVRALAGDPSVATRDAVRSDRST